MESGVGDNCPSISIDRAAKFESDHQSWTLIMLLNSTMVILPMR